MEKKSRPGVRDDPRLCDAVGSVSRNDAPHLTVASPAIALPRDIECVGPVVQLYDGARRPGCKPQGVCLAALLTPIYSQCQV